MQHIRDGSNKNLITQSQNLWLPYVEAAFTVLQVIKYTSSRFPSEWFVGIDLHKHRYIQYELKRFGEFGDERCGNEFGDEVSSASRR